MCQTTFPYNLHGKPFCFTFLDINILYFFHPQCSKVLNTLRVFKVTVEICEALYAYRFLKVSKEDTFRIII